MTVEPTDPASSPRPVLTQEVLDRLVAEGMAEDQAKLAKAAEKQRRAKAKALKTAGRQAPPMDSPPADAAGVSKTATGAAGADTSKESQ